MCTRRSRRSLQTLRGLATWLCNWLVAGLCKPKSSATTSKQRSSTPKLSRESAMLKPWGAGLAITTSLPLTAGAATGAAQGFRDPRSVRSVARLLNDSAALGTREDGLFVREAGLNARDGRQAAAEVQRGGNTSATPKPAMRPSAEDTEREGRGSSQSRHSLRTSVGGAVRAPLRSSGFRPRRKEPPPQPTGEGEDAAMLRLEVQRLGANAEVLCKARRGVSAREVQPGSTTTS